MDNLISKKKVLNVAGSFIELAGEANDTSALEHVQTELAQFRLGLFRIVVVGEVKKGKSSFINALLGEPDLLPTASDVATSTVYKLMYGKPKKIKVFSLPDDATDKSPAPIEITNDQLHEFGTENGNPNNQKKVDFIGIQLPHPLLKSGVAIIDTPGLGGLFEKHRDITWRYIPKADAVFFIFDSVEAVVSKDEMEYLSKFREFSPLIFFVQTKTDLVEESEWKQWRERNLEIISKELGVRAAKLIYFPVSSTLKFEADTQHSQKHLDRSGYSALLYFLYNKLLPKKEDQLGRRLLSTLSVESIGIHRKMSDRLRIASTETKDGLDALEKDFIETKAKFEQWKAADLQRALVAFQDDTNALKRKTLEKFRQKLDPSPISNSVISKIVEGLSHSDVNAKILSEQADIILADCIDQCSRIVFDIQGEYNDEMYRVVNDLSSAIGKTLPVETRTPIAGISEAHIDRLNMQFSGFDKARNAVYGGMAGTMMAHLGVGILSLIFPPVAAAGAIATVIGGFIGGRIADINLQGQRRAQAINLLQNILSDSMRRAQSEALHQFESISSEYYKSLRDSLCKATSEVEKEIADKLNSITEQRQQSRESSKKKNDFLQAILERNNELLQNLARLLESNTEGT